MSLESRISNLETFFITDQSRIDAFEVCKKLPKNSHVILRDYDHPQREQLAKDIQKLCRKYKLRFLIAKTPRLAMKLKADGVHFPQFMHARINHWKSRKPNWIITASVHNQKEIFRTNNADFYLISPIFKTESHANTKPLGIGKLNRIILQNCNKSFVVLGGINGKSAKKLKNLAIAGLAGISEIASCGDFATKCAQKQLFEQKKR